MKFTQQHKDKLPNMMVEMVEVLEQLYNTPEEMSLPIILATMNHPAQALADVNPIQWPVSPLSLYFAVLADTGGQKSTLMNAVTKGITNFEKAQRHVYDQQVRDYKVLKRTYDDEIKKITDVSNGNHVPKEPESPRSFQVTVQKATLNGIIEVLRDTPFAGLFNPDAAEFFNSHSFQDKERGVEMITSLAKLYSGESVSRQTGVKEANITLNNRRFNMLVLLQQQLAGVFTNSTFTDQGFVPRVLISQPPVVPSVPFDFSPAAVSRRDALQKRLIPFHDRITELLNSVYAAQDKAEKYALEDALGVPFSNKELKLNRMSFDIDAYGVLEQFGNRMQEASERATDNATRGYLRRTYDSACRIAATLAVFERETTISKKLTEGAIAIVDWFTDQRARLVIEPNVEESEEVMIANAVHKWLLKQDKCVSLTALNNGGPQVYRKAKGDMKKAALNDLSRRELLTTTEIDKKTMLTGVRFDQ